MGQRFESINERHQAFIEDQKLFFVATATSDSRINLSPKGMDSLRILNPHKVIWLNLTGSGNETAAHLKHNTRMTIMFCAFEGKPMILRLYGHAKIYHHGDAEFQANIDLFPDFHGTRQIISMDVDLVQTSCGMAVPYMDFAGERNDLETWAEKITPDKLKQYRKNKNQVSLDGDDIY